MPKTKRRIRKSSPPSQSTKQISGSGNTILKDTDPKQRGFNPATLDRTVIAIPLLLDLEKEKLSGAPQLHAVIIDLNLEFPGGRRSAAEYVKARIETLLAGNELMTGEGLRPEKQTTEQYLFAKLSGNTIRELVAEDGKKTDSLKKKIVADAVKKIRESGGDVTPTRNQPTKAAPTKRAIYHIWPDFKVRRLTDRTISTVKADAAWASFSAFGHGIVWAVLDSGIEAKHPHFRLHKNLEPQPPLTHFDFTGANRPDIDPFGHGTHVAGIIAGEVKKPVRAAVSYRNEDGETEYGEVKPRAISGMAPRCKLINMRVLDDQGNGEVSSIIAALSKIQEINGYGRRLLIQGANISIGNDFEPEWFACGQSPLCVEVDRLVKSGVVVVVAAGNSGYGTIATEFTGEVKMGMALTINDPGNSQLAITVGSTHRHMPHTYGVSYFSSKGPTGDGRIKPDLVAPGEKIISCAAGDARRQVGNSRRPYDYIENSGTSMAAPHVSGVIAAFLSVRREFIGQPEKVKEIFCSTATNLHRERYFQGNGLVDIMRAIQSV